MTEDEHIELIARAICVAERMNPDDALGGWIHWKKTAEAVKKMTDFINKFGDRIDFTALHPRDIHDDIMFAYRGDWPQLWVKEGENNENLA